MNNSFKVGGALLADSPIYIEREADSRALRHMRNLDYLLVIEPRQQGKTSLINHLMRHPALVDSAFAYVDMTTPDHSSETTWYNTLCSRILRQLRHLIPHNRWPILPQSPAGLRDFLWYLAASAIDANLRVIIALDEIGAVTFQGATNFFSVLRDVYNSREAEAEFKQITFLLSGAFHPRDLIEDERISPFNVAQRVRLDDFDLTQVGELVEKGPWSPNQAIALAKRIHFWTDGQPYLTQLLCSYLEPDANPSDVDNGVERLRREDENHLPPLLDRFNNKGSLRQYADKVYAGERIKFYPGENRRQAQLELLGVLKSDDDGYCRIRNRICELALFPSPQSNPSILLPSKLANGETDMNYQRGLDDFRQIAEGTGWYQDFTVYEAALCENLTDEQRYGPSEQVRRDRTRIVDQLNSLALQRLGVSFNDLCLGKREPSISVFVEPNEIVERLRRIEGKFDYGRAADRQTAEAILNAIAANEIALTDAAQMTNELRTWTKAIEQSGMPLEPEIQEAINALTEHSGSAYQYLQLALPIIPGILSYNVELGSDHQADLPVIWERIRKRFGKA